MGNVHKVKTEELKNEKYLQFEEIFNTDTFCQKTNLTSHHEILTRERETI